MYRYWRFPRKLEMIDKKKLFAMRTYIISGACNQTCVGAVTLACKCLSFVKYYSFILPITKAIYLCAGVWTVNWFSVQHKFIEHKYGNSIKSGILGLNVLITFYLIIFLLCVCVYMMYSRT